MGDEEQWKNRYTVKQNSMSNRRKRRRSGDKDRSGMDCTSKYAAILATGFALYERKKLGNRRLMSFR